ncbi:MAG: hypothetical protein ACYS29_04930 [Planctomycetota bacterium]|jgi:hypothetical protein
MPKEQNNPSNETPKKKRFAWWKISLAVFTLVIALFALKVVLILNGKPLVTITDDDLRNVSRPSDYDPDKDAGRLYLEAISALSDIPALIEDEPWYSLIMTDPNDVRPISTWLRENENGLRLLEHAASRPYFWMAGSKELDGNILPFIDAAKAFYYRAALSASRGEIDAACKDIVTCHRLGQHFEGPLPVIEQMAGLVIRAIAAEGALLIISIFQPRAQTIRLLEQHLQPVISEGAPVLDLRYERLFRTYLIQGWFTDDGKGDGHLIPQGFFVEGTRIFPDGYQITEREFHLGLLVRYPKSIWEAMTGPRKKQTLELLERSYTCFNEVTLQTPWHTNAEAKTELNELSEKLSQNSFLEPTGWNSGLLSQIERAHEVRTKELGCVASLKILCFKLDKGRFPHNLQDLLASGYFEELPMDPYSDGPLVYRRLDDDFMLYSVGADFDDDGGIPSERARSGGDLVFWPVEE